MIRVVSICWGLWFTLALLNPTVWAAERSKPIETLYAETERASVEVLVDGHLAGSGCFVDTQGSIITAAHLIAKPHQQIEVLSPTAGRLHANIVAVDLGHDLLLLRVEQRDGGYPALRLSTELPAAGDEVYLYGSSVYRHGLIQPGSIARRQLTFEYQSHFVEVLQVAAIVQEGTSGGPWISSEGELIGIQSGSITSKSVAVGIANVSPVDAVRALLKSKRNAATPTVGLFVDELWVLPGEALKRFAAATEGVVIQALQDGGPAARAGLKQGEVITAVDDRVIRYRDDLIRTIRSKRPGQTIMLDVVSPDRAGTRKLSVEIGTLEGDWPRGGNKK